MPQAQAPPWSKIKRNKEPLAYLVPISTHFPTEGAQWLDTQWATHTCSWEEVEDSKACLSLLWL